MANVEEAARGLLKALNEHQAHMRARGQWYSPETKRLGTLG